jgi:hypothetical protein
VLCDAGLDLALSSFCCVGIHNVVHVMHNSQALSDDHAASLAVPTTGRQCMLLLGGTTPALLSNCLPTKFWTSAEPCVW